MDHTEEKYNCALSGLSLPPQSDSFAAVPGGPAHIASLLQAASQQRAEADQKWDSLVELLINEFSKQAAVITKLKMQGQIDTPVAKKLLKNVPEDLAAGGEQEERRAAEIERQELNQLMSVEMQLSPVRGGGHYGRGLEAGGSEINLNQSNLLSLAATPLSLNAPTQEAREFSQQPQMTENQGVSDHTESESGRGSSSGSNTSGSSQVSESTQFEQVVRVEEDEEQGSKNESSLVTSMTSSKIEKVSVLQGQEVIQHNPFKPQDGSKDGDKRAGNPESTLMRQNVAMRRHKRQISLSEIPDDNKRELEPEVSVTPSGREVNQAMLLVNTENGSPARQPPLTSKKRTATATFKQPSSPEAPLTNQKSKQGGNQTTTPIKKQPPFRLQIQATSSKNTSSNDDSDQIEAMILGKKASSSARLFDLKPLQINVINTPQPKANLDTNDSFNDRQSSDGTSCELILKDATPQLPGASKGLGLTIGVPVTSRTDTRKTVAANHNNLRKSATVISNRATSNMEGGSSYPSRNPSINVHSVDGMSFARRRASLQPALSQRNFKGSSLAMADAQSNLDEFNLMATGKLAVTSSVSQTESKLIIALRKQLLEAKRLLESEHSVKMRLIEGARDLKRQLVEALKHKQRLSLPQKHLRYESGNQDSVRGGAGGEDDQPIRASSEQESESSEASGHSIESPLVRMKVSSATQTEAQGVKGSEGHLVDADSGGSQVKPDLQTTDAQAQTDPEADLMEQSQQDLLQSEMEIQRLIEHHEVESARLRYNTDFWKGKVDGLIKSQKEMLEDKTRLHTQLERSETLLQAQQSKVRQLTEEMESLQRQVARQKYLHPQQQVGEPQFLELDVDQEVKTSQAMMSGVESTQYKQISSAQNAKQPAALIQGNSQLHQRFKNADIDGRLDLTSMTHQTEDNSFVNHKPPQSATLPKRNLNGLPRHEQHNPAARKNNQSPAKHAAKRAVIRKNGQPATQALLTPSALAQGPQEPNHNRLMTAKGVAENKLTASRFSSPDIVPPGLQANQKGGLGTQSRTALSNRTKLPANALRPAPKGTSANEKPPLKLRNSSEKKKQYQQSRRQPSGSNNGNASSQARQVQGPGDQQSHDDYSYGITPASASHSFITATNASFNYSSVQVQPSQRSSKAQNMTSQQQLKKNTRLLQSKNAAQGEGSLQGGPSALETPQMVNSQSLQLNQTRPAHKGMTSVKDQFSKLVKRHTAKKTDQNSQQVSQAPSTDQSIPKYTMQQLIRDRLLPKAYQEVKGSQLNTSQIHHPSSRQGKQRNLLTGANQSQLLLPSRSFAGGVDNSQLYQEGEEGSKSGDRSGPSSRGDRLTPSRTAMLHRTEMNLESFIRGQGQEEAEGQQQIGDDNRNEQTFTEDEFLSAENGGANNGATGATGNNQFVSKMTRSVSHNNTTTSIDHSNNETNPATSILQNTMLESRQSNRGSAIKGSSLGRTQELIQKKTATTGPQGARSQAIGTSGLNSHRSSGGGAISARSKFITQQANSSGPGVMATSGQRMAGQQQHTTPIPGRIMSLNQQSASSGNPQTRLIAAQTGRSQGDQRHPTPQVPPRRQNNAAGPSLPDSIEPSDSDAMLKRYL